MKDPRIFQAACLQMSDIFENFSFDYRHSEELGPEHWELFRKILTQDTPPRRGPSGDHLARDVLMTNSCLTSNGERIFTDFRRATRKQNSAKERRRVLSDDLKCKDSFMARRRTSSRKVCLRGSVSNTALKRSLSRARLSRPSPSHPPLCRPLLWSDRMAARSRGCRLAAWRDR